MTRRRPYPPTTDVVEQPDFARIMIASQRETKTVIIQGNRRLSQNCDLASDTQSLFRFGDQFWRHSHTSKKRLYRHAGAFETRDRQAGKAPLRHRD